MKVALLPWGDVIEDFLEGIGLSFERFQNEMTGGWLFGYVEALKRRSIETVVLCFSARYEPRRTVHRPTGAALRVLPASRLYRAARVAPSGARSYLATPLAELRAALAEEACTVILCQEYEYPRFDLCVWLGRRMGLPVFGTFQGGDWQASLLERPIRPWSLRRCDGLIVGPLTEFERLRARYGVPPEKIARIHNPLDVDRWHRDGRPDARRELGLSPHAKVVVWHGRVDLRRKGLDVLVRSWAKVSRARPSLELRLLLVGTGPDAPALRAEIESVALDDVIWFDEYVLDRDRVRRFLAAADLYVLPSRHEGFPVAPLEAMASGLPIVATDAPGVPDILERGEDSGGTLVSRGDEEGLAAALLRVLDDDELRERLGRRARRRVEEQFSLAAVGEALEAHLFGKRDGSSRIAANGPTPAS